MSVIHNNSSSAYKLEYGYNYIPSYQPDYEVDYEQKKKKTKSKKEQLNRKANPIVILWIMVMFAALFLVVFRYVEINEANNLVSKYKTEYNKIKTQNEQLQLEIEKSVDLSYIENYAKSELGMSTPEKYQVVYISLDKNDYSEIPYHSPIKKKDNNLKMLMGKIANVLEYLH